MSINNFNTWAKNSDDFYMKIEHKKDGDELVLKSRKGFDAVTTFFDLLLHKQIIDFRQSLHI